MNADGLVDITILGAGICGLAAATMLARDGHEVTLLERDADPAPDSGDAAWGSWARDGVVQFRQAHYLVSEHWGRWHKAWTGIFTKVDKRTGGMNDWTRYRISRVLKLLFILAIIDLALAKIYHLPPATALIQLPIAIVKALPFAFQLAFGFFFIVFQFVGLFWFMKNW